MRSTNSDGKVAPNSTVLLYDPTINFFLFPAHSACYFCFFFFKIIVVFVLLPLFILLVAINMAVASGRAGPVLAGPLLMFVSEDGVWS